MKATILRLVCAAGTVFGATAIASADPIEGMWRTGDKVLMKVSNCGGTFCFDVADGKYVGKRSGTLAPKGGAYEGTLKQFSTGMTFAGVATVSGGTMSLVAKKFGMVVKRDTWTRQ